MSGPVAGLAEIVLWVRDMDAAMHFYRDLFGLEVISPPELPNKFLRAGGGGEGVPEMIVLVPHPDASSSFPREKAKRVLHHLAFRVEASAYDELQSRFPPEGIQVRSGSWKRAFDSDPADRKGSGVRRYHVMRSVEDPNYVMIDLEFDSLEDAEGLLAKMRRVWSGDGQKVMRNPQARIVDTVEAIEF